MNFLLLIVCLSAGWAFRASRLLPEDSYKGINIWILYVALPAVALLYIPEIVLNKALIVPIAMPFLVWVGAWSVSKYVAPRLNLDSGTTAALLLTSGLGNTSFVGFPLTQAYFGEEGLRIAVICDQLTFLILSTFGVMTALRFSNNGVSDARLMMRNILRFPPFVAFAAALVLPHFLDIRLFNPLLEKLAVTLVPLALFSVGMQLRISEWTIEAKPIVVGLGYKLIVAPTMILLLAMAFQYKGIVPQASVFESAMPPMITSAILAGEYGLNPRLSNLMVSIGILAALITTALWSLIIHTLL